MKIERLQMHLNISKHQTTLIHPHIPSLRKLINSISSHVTAAWRPCYTGIRPDIHTEIESKYFAKDRYLSYSCVQYIYLLKFQAHKWKQPEPVNCVEDIETQMKEFWMNIFSVVLVSITFDERPPSRSNHHHRVKNEPKFTFAGVRVKNTENFFLMIFQ